MAQPEVELDSLAVFPVLHAGDIDSFLRLNRRYFILLDDPKLPSKTRWTVLQQIALNFRSLDYWLSQGKPLPLAWERRIGVEVDSEGSVAEETERDACGDACARSVETKGRK